MVLVVKNLPDARDARGIGLIPGLGRPLGEGNVASPKIKTGLGRHAWVTKSQTLEADLLNTQYSSSLISLI